MKTFLNFLKNILSDIIDYFLNFDRSKTWLLIGSLFLVSIISTLIVLIPTFLYYKTVEPQFSLPSSLDNSARLIGIIVDKGFLINGISLLIYAFLSPHFMSFTRNERYVTISQATKKCFSSKMEPLICIYRHY